MALLDGDVITFENCWGAPTAHEEHQIADRTVNWIDAAAVVILCYYPIFIVSFQ
jgi:hypothetical protein